VLFNSNARSSFRLGASHRQGEGDPKDVYSALRRMTISGLRTIALPGFTVRTLAIARP
jgi:hypothetical protein